MSDEEAKLNYLNILRHKDILSRKLNREIGLRVPALDYFLNLSKSLKNPKFVENELFEEMLSQCKEDTKTGCYNINFFKETLDKEIKRAMRYETAMSVILLDIDNFKQLNDTFGHLFGDKILKDFARLVMDNLRAEDILARYGGDEFVILLPQTGRIGARSMAERLRINLSNHFNNQEYYNGKIQITFSAGISTFPYDADGYESLLDCADKALYRSKFLGKNRVYDYLDKANEQDSADELKEKRQARRYKILTENNVDFSNGKSFLNINGKILNISSNGALVECNFNLSDDLLFKPLILKLVKIGDKEIDNLNIRGEIVRLNKEGNRLKFYLAIKIEETLDNTQWNLIENYGKLECK